MSFLLFLAGAAWAGCDVVETHSEVDGEADRRWQISVSDGKAGCQRLVLGSAVALEPTRVRVLVEQSNATRKRFGSERVRHEEGHWVLYLPELRNGDWATVRLDADVSETDPRWFSEKTRTLPDPGTMGVQLTADDDPAFGPGGTVSALHQLGWDNLAGPGVWRWWAPAGATNVVCGLTGSEAPVSGVAHERGCLISLADDDEARLQISWTEHDASSAGEFDLPGVARLKLSGARFSTAGLDAVSVDEGLEAVGPGTLSYRVTHMRGIDVPDTVIDQIELDANAVSIPEPGIGLVYKDRRADMSVLPEILQLVRRQMVYGRLPGTHPLHPRPLMKARRSRWGTPWEQALLLARYLQQLHIPATAYPVRPQSAGLAEAGAPVGYTGAVVRAGTADSSVWLDPSCAVCGAGEITPSLWGGQVLAHDLQRLPAHPESVRTVHTDNGRTTVKLSGIHAVEFRQWLADFPVDDRERAITSQFGGQNTALVEIDGLANLGAPIRFVVQSRR